MICAGFVSESWRAREKLRESENQVGKKLKIKK
jgi:hypothetical protein